MIREVLDWLIANPAVGTELIRATATIAAALIVGVAGTIITRRFQLRRDRQDRESQWRSHAVELTKLELQRKVELLKLDRELGTLTPDYERPQQAILDFLAHYRDLQELGTKKPKDLYIDIRQGRIREPANRERLGTGTSSESGVQNKETRREETDGSAS